MLCIFHSYHDAAKVSTEGVKDYQERSASLVDDPELRDPASTPPGNMLFVFVVNKAYYYRTAGMDLPGRPD